MTDSPKRYDYRCGFPIEVFDCRSRNILATCRDVADAERIVEALNKPQEVRSAQREQQPEPADA